MGDSLIANVEGLRAGTNTTYVWTVNGSVISRESSLYLGQPEYTSASIKLSITGKKSGFKDFKYTSPVITEGAITRIKEGSVSGQAVVRENSVLTATCGTFVPPIGLESANSQCDYQWKADGTNIDGATGENLALTENLIGKTISVITTVSSVAMASQTYAVNAPQKPVGEITSVTQPTFSGDGMVDSVQTLETAPTFNTDGVTLTYQWYRGATKIKNATAPQYVLTSADWHKAISLQITASKANYIKSVETWAVQEYVRKLITKSGNTLSGYAAWDSCDYDYYISYDCWKHTNNAKWACAWNDENYDDDYTLMNLSGYAPAISGQIIEWRAVLTGSIGNVGGILVTNSADEGMEFLDVNSSVYYESGTTWRSSWSTLAPTSDGLFHVGVYTGSYGGFIVKSLKIEVRYIG